jgi:hypothetical protein
LDAFLNFLPPQRIDRFVGFVETGKELVDEASFFYGRKLH